MIADGTVRPADFFHAGLARNERLSVVGNLLGVYASPTRPDLSGFQEGLATPAEIERLSGDIHCCRQLLAACLQSPHEEIVRAADTDAEIEATCVFIERAASLPSALHVEGIDLVVPMMDKLLQDRAMGPHPVVDHGYVVDALHERLTGALHLDARRTYHSYALKFIAGWPASPDKAVDAEKFVLAAAMLAAEHQRQAFSDAFQMVVGIPRADPDPVARTEVLARSTMCTHALRLLHVAAFGQSAVDVLRASDTVADGPIRMEICKAVAQVALDPRPDTGEVRFASLSEADKVDLFLELLDGSLGRWYRAGGQWGSRMLPHLPHGVQRQAADLLMLAERGQRPMQGYRHAAGSWQW